jgi:hypothetical protein
MTLFEYLAIAFSLLFSFSAMRLVAGLPHALLSGRRYWVHSCLVALQLILTVQVFWLFWNFRNVNWTFPTFVLVLMSPSLIYMNACTLVPESPSSVDSWRAYFDLVRRRYFVGVGCWCLALATISTVVLKMPLFHPARGVQAAVLAVSVVGAISTSHRVQSVIAVSLLTLSLGVALILGLRPDYLAPQ